MRNLKIKPEMATRKIFGYIFVAVAIILSIAIVGQISAILKLIFNIFKMFTGTLDSYAIGLTLGSLCYWIFHIGVTILLWTSGRKRIKKVSIS